MEVILVARERSEEEQGVRDPAPWSIEALTPEVSERLVEMRKIVDQIKRKRQLEARQKKFKTNHAKK